MTNRQDVVMAGRRRRHHVSTRICSVSVVLASDAALLDIGLYPAQILRLLILTSFPKNEAESFYSAGPSVGYAVFSSFSGPSNTRAVPPSVNEWRERVVNAIATTTSHSHDV